MRVYEYERYSYENLICIYVILKRMVYVPARYHVRLQVKL